VVEKFVGSSSGVVFVPWAVLYAVWDRQATLVCLRMGMAHRIGLSFGRTVGFHSGAVQSVAAVTGANNTLVRRGMRPVSQCDARHVTRQYLQQETLKRDRKHRTNARRRRQTERCIDVEGKCFSNMHVSN
jgi:hypothetical protein